jgi:hypothetical protein
MAFSSGIVVEVRSTGSDSNGGGFVAAGGGTDYTQQNSSQVAFNGSTVTATSAGSTATITLTGHTGVAADVGNVLQITGGTNFVLGFYQIISATATTWTLDRHVDNGSAGSAMTGNMGGALATLNTAVVTSLLCETANATVYLKAAVYQISASINYTGLTGSPGGGSGIVRTIGYSTTRGDGGQATLQCNSSSMDLINALQDFASVSLSFENIIFDGNSLSTTQAVNAATASGGNTIAITFVNCVFKRFTGNFVVTANAVGATANFAFYHCDFLNNAFAQNNAFCIDATYLTQGLVVVGCYFAGNSSSGTNTNACISYGSAYPPIAPSIVNCIFYNNTGTNFFPLYNKTTAFFSGLIQNCIFHSNSSHAINAPTSLGVMNPVIENCIFTSNGGYGINIAVGGIPTIVTIRNNAFYNNTSGNVNGFNDGGSNQSLGGLPYVSAGSNFALNATYGAACKAAGYPGNIGAASNVGTGYQDIGALQSSGGSAGNSISGYFG